jgi:Uma2 family endonuclease
MTAEELLRLPSGNGRHELVKGELRSMSPAGQEHGAVAAEMLGALMPFIRQHNLGRVYAAETGFILRRQPDTVRAPDVAFVGADRLAITSRSAEGYFPGAPDLAVEVISPSDRYTEVEAKVEEWLDAGAQVVVVLDPRRQVAKVYAAGVAVESLSIEDQLALPDLLPGWSVALRDIFR